jgi:hypothetical protein
LKKIGIPFTVSKIGTVHQLLYLNKHNLFFALGFGLPTAFVTL